MTETQSAEAGTFERHDVEFESGGERCAAWLYLPSGDAPHPVIVMAHGLGGTREMRLDAYAERFVARGYACLVFDYRHFGASGGAPRGLLAVRRQLADWHAAIAFARGLPELDSERVVVWGTSFGGGHAIRVAAEDGRVAAAVSQCPFTDGVASLRAINPRTLLRLGSPALRDVVSVLTGRAPVRVPTSGPPGSAALMTAPDAAPGVEALVESTGHGDEVDDEVAARLALVVAAYRPGRAAARVSCPILFCVCEPDSVAPAKATLSHAQRATRGQIRTYPYGHFEIYFGDAFERVIADQVAFLERTVPIG